MTQFICQSAWDSSNFNTLTLEITTDMITCVGLEIHGCKQPYALHYLHIGPNRTEIRQALPNALTYQSKRPIAPDDFISQSEKDYIYNYTCDIPARPGCKLIFKTPIRCKAAWLVQTK